MSTDGTRSFTWTSFNMPLTISKTATVPSPGSGTATFNYGAEHQRVKQTWVSGATTTTVYLPEFDFEKVIDSTGSTYRHYIKADGRLVANVTRAPAGNTVNYVITDHLGSPSVLIDASGAVVDRLAYDPWGDRRFTNGAFDPTNTIQPTSTNRGYTGHEMLDQGNVGLVHMNGRVYDPTLGRFTSADLFVQDSFATQSFNRYAYVVNAPLNFVDPTGYTDEDPPQPLPNLDRVTITGSSAGDFIFTASNGGGAGHGRATLAPVTIVGSMNIGSATSNSLVAGSGSGAKASTKPDDKTACDQSSSASADQSNHLSTGVAISGASVNPVTSGGGGVAGRNWQSVPGGTATLNSYDYSGKGAGLDVGGSIQSVWAWGSGSWTGDFKSVNFNAGIFSGSLFWSPGKGGYVGVSGGLGIGLPGVSYEETYYTCTKRG